MSSVLRVPSKISEIDRALKAMGFRIQERRSGGHPVYKHPMAEQVLTVPGTPRSAGTTLKRALSRARKILREAGVTQP